MEKFRGGSRALKGLMVLALVAGVTGPLAITPSATRAAEENELGEIMNVVNDNYKLLRRTARRKNFDDESVKQAVAMQEASLKAMHMEPPMAGPLSGAEREQFIIGYRKEMKGLMIALMDLEIALLEKRHDEIDGLLDQINTLKLEGHEKFVEE